MIGSLERVNFKEVKERKRDLQPFLEEKLKLTKGPKFGTWMGLSRRFATLKGIRIKFLVPRWVLYTIFVTGWVLKQAQWFQKSKVLVLLRA